MKHRKILRAEAAHAHDIIRMRILTREFAPGTPLVLRSLAADLGTDVVPVRNALHRLAEERLATGRNGGGWTVPLLSAEAVRELCIQREVLEVRSARRCALRAGVGGVAHLRLLADEIKSSKREAAWDPVEPWEWRFHAAIAEIAGSPVLREQIEQTLVVRLAWRPEGWGAAHDDLVDAIAAGDQDGAGQAMHRHLQPNLRLPLSTTRDGNEDEDPSAVERPLATRESRVHAGRRGGRRICVAACAAMVGFLFRHREWLGLERGRYPAG